MQEDMGEDVPGTGDVPAGVGEAVGGVLASKEYGNRGINIPENQTNEHREKKSLSKLARGAIFREVVLAKVREVKEAKAQKQFEEEVTRQNSRQ